MSSQKPLSSNAESDPRRNARNRAGDSTDRQPVNLPAVDGYLASFSPSPGIIPASQEIMHRLQFQNMFRPDLRNLEALSSREQQLRQRLNALHLEAEERQRSHALSLQSLFARYVTGRQHSNQLYWSVGMPNPLSDHHNPQGLATPSTPSLGYASPDLWLNQILQSQSRGGIAATSILERPPLPMLPQGYSLSWLTSSLQHPGLSPFRSMYSPTLPDGAYNQAVPSHQHLSPAIPDAGIMRPTRDMLGASQRMQLQGHEEEEMKFASLSEHKRDSSSESSDERISVGDRVYPSERSSLSLRDGCCSPRESYRIMKVLGTTLRSKKDPFIDVALLPEPEGPGENRVIRGSDRFFPDQLHSMLLEIEQEARYTNVVSFMPHGRAFRVHEKETFIKDVLPKYFGGQGKWTSFLRQVKLYGFLRISSGADCNAYYHELFLRTKPELTKFMRRVGTPKGLDRRTYRIADGDDPDFYSSTFAPLTEPTSAISQPEEVR